MALVRRRPLYGKDLYADPPCTPMATSPPTYTHTLSLLQEPPYVSAFYMCHVCWERGSGPLYHCADCQLDFHLTCVGSPQQPVTSHPSHYQHPLHLRATSRGGGSGSQLCDGCCMQLSMWSYHCDSCDFDLCALCVRAPRFLLHISHPHVLIRSLIGEFGGSCECDGCGRPASGIVYRCTSCNFDLHESCIRLPLKPYHPRHPEHPLTLRCRKDDMEWSSSYTCNFCGREGRGWSYMCSTCRISVHPACAKILHEVPRSTSMQNWRGETRTVPRADIYDAWSYRGDNYDHDQYAEHDHHGISSPTYRSPYNVGQRRGYLPSIHQPITANPYNDHTYSPTRLSSPRYDGGPSGLPIDHGAWDSHDVAPESIVHALQKLALSLSPRDAAAVDRIVSLFRQRGRPY